MNICLDSKLVCIARVTGSLACQKQGRQMLVLCLHVLTSFQKASKLRSRGSWTSYSKNIGWNFLCTPIRAYRMIDIALFPDEVGFDSKLSHFPRSCYLVISLPPLSGSGGVPAELASVFVCWRLLPVALPPGLRCRCLLYEFTS